MYVPDHSTFINRYNRGSIVPRQPNIRILLRCMMMMMTSESDPEIYDIAC